MSGYAPDPEFQRALDSIDVETYLDREGVDYRLSYGTRGLQLNLRECPSCGEEGFKTYINAESGLGNCFHGACSFKFNRFKLFRCVSGLSGHAFSEYVTTVAAEQGWMPKKKRPELVQAELKLPSKTFTLPCDGQNLAYLAERGITLASCIHFHLHFCQGGWWGYLLEDGTEKWMGFDDRVIFPIKDLAGNMVSFQGRDITGEQIPKYLFPVGFAVSGSHLYNGDSFDTHKHAVVGEGVFDAIAIHQAVVDRPDTAEIIALATFGMHLSGGPDGQVSKFLDLKERGLKVVTFMWDGELKATRAAIKAGIELMSIGLQVRIASLPPGKDPNEITPAEVRKAIFEATPLTRLSAVKILSRAASSHR